MLTTKHQHGLRCPNIECESFGNDVVDSRTRDNYIYRRRQCNGCQTRFTTIEMRKIDINLLGKINDNLLRAYTMLNSIQQISKKIIGLRDIDSY